MTPIRRLWREASGPGWGPLPELLLALTLVTGLVDAVSILALGRVFVANMTGNVVFAGFAIAGAPRFLAEHLSVRAGRLPDRGRARRPAHPPGGPRPRAAPAGGDGGRARPRRGRAGDRGDVRGPGRQPRHRVPHDAAPHDTARGDGPRRTGQRPGGLLRHRGRGRARAGAGHRDGHPELDGPQARGAGPHHDGAHHDAHRHRGRPPLRPAGESHAGSPPAGRRPHARRRRPRRVAGPAGQHNSRDRRRGGPAPRRRCLLGARRPDAGAVAARRPGAGSPGSAGPTPPAPPPAPSPR